MKENANIMESSIEDLLELLRFYMLRFENATQLTKDDKTAEYIDASVTELDKYLHKIKDLGNATVPDRNSIRLICKETYRLIPVEVLQELEESPNTTIVIAVTRLHSLKDSPGPRRDIFNLK